VKLVTLDDLAADDPAEALARRRASVHAITDPAVDDVRYSLAIYSPSDTPVTASAGVFLFPEQQ